MQSTYKMRSAAHWPNAASRQAFLSGRGPQGAGAQHRYRQRAAAKQPTAVAPSADVLRQAASGQQFGAAATDQQRQHLLQLVSELKASGTPKAQVPPTEGPLEGSWRLLWTSEASVHGILKGPIPVTDIQQHIELQSGRVTNTIRFGVLGLQLQASGPMNVLNSSRVYYSFDRLALRVLGLQLPLPVFFKGGGWTDCVLLLDSGSLRVMENSRRDTLLLQRCSSENSQQQ